MALSLPYSLSPSKVSSFTDCALAFRFSAIDRLPEPPAVPATRGTLVHRALERLFALPPAQRTLAAALTELDESFDELRPHPDYTGLHLDEDDQQQFLDQAEALVRRYFDLEDPALIHPIGLELNLELEVDGLRLRGIIDRLELDPEGNFVVTDYKTGKVPSAEQERARLGGVHFYSFLCEQLFGTRPARVQLLYLAEPVAIVTTPTEQSTRGLERKVKAVWSAVERACERDDFRPEPSRLCDWCAFKAFCPAFGGDPDEARVLAEHRAAEATRAGEAPDTTAAPPAETRAETPAKAPTAQPTLDFTSASAPGPGDAVAAALARTHEWFAHHSGWAPPDEGTLVEWLADGVCRAPDDCLVTPTTSCPHGLASWWLVLRALGDVPPLDAGRGTGAGSRGTARLGSAL